MSNTKLRKTTLRKATKEVGVNVSKLDVFMQYFNDEVLWEPDPSRPKLPILTSEQQDMFKKYTFAWSQLSIGRTDEMVRSALEKQFNIKEGMARLIIKECYVLYGDMAEVNRKGKIRAAVLYLETLSNLARVEKDYRTAKEAWAEAKKLEGLYREDAAGWTPSDFLSKVTIVFSDNINVLKQAQKDDDE